MNKMGFVQAVKADLLAKKNHNKLSLEKLASTFDIESKNDVKEFTELAICLVARELAHS